MIATRNEVLSGSPHPSRRTATTKGAATRARGKSQSRNVVTVGAFEFNVPLTGDAVLDEGRARVLAVFKGTGPEHAVKVGVLCEVLEVSCGAVSEIMAGLKIGGVPVEPFKSTSDGQFIESYFIAHGGIEQAGTGNDKLRARIANLFHDLGAYCKSSAIPLSTLIECLDDVPVEDIADALNCFVGADFAIVRAIGVKFKEQIDCYYLIQTKSGLAKYLCELVGESRRISDERNALEGVAKYLAEV